LIRRGKGRAIDSEMEMGGYPKLGGSQPKPDPKPDPKPPKPTPKPTGKYKLYQSETLQDSKGKLPEISGIARSLTYKDIFYVHNDSGSKPEIYGLTLDGKIRTKIEVKASARDWEDITTAPCGNQNCIYVADFGNNGHKRTDLTIYKIVEPKLAQESRVNAERYGFKYSTGISHNAEGLAYNPKDKYFYIATKGKNWLYKLPKVLFDGMVAEKLCEFPIKNPVTALDFDSEGKMLVRTKKDVYEYADASCDKLLTKDDYDYKEKQGEAVTYLGHGRSGFVSISEGNKPKVYVFKK